jgi:hypothetical protein
VKQTSLNGQGPHVDGPNDEASGEGDMLWQYDTMASPLPAELADEDYEELMLVMERALYDDLQAELQIQGTINFLLERTYPLLSSSFASPFALSQRLFPGVNQ